MKIAGIIAEYNPFHEGHRYHLQKALEITGAEGLIVVMSGDYVQRGEPAIIDKYRRAEMALAAGADVVLELPLSWATGTAERFAEGAVFSLHSLGIVTDLVCGSECSTPDLMARLSEILVSLPAPGDTSLSPDERNLPWPVLRARLAEQQLPGSGALMSSPNNILALEYRKAIRSISGCTIIPHEILRVGSSYHEETLSPGDRYPSATAIREQSLAHRKTVFHPDYKAERLSDRFLDYAISPDDLSSQLHYSILTSSPEELACFQDMNRDLAMRMTRLMEDNPTVTFREMAGLLKNRGITRTRANRALLHSLLKLRPSGRYPSALRLLGMRRGTSVMKEVKAHSSIPIVTKMADAPVDCFRDDIRAAHLYNRLVYDQFHITIQDEYRRGPVIL